MTSILETVRDEGRREAFAQLSMMKHDDAFAAGQREAYGRARSWWTWFIPGLLIGAGLTVAHYENVECPRIAGTPARAR